MNKHTLFNLDLNTIKKDGETIAELTIDGIIGEDWWASESDQNTKQAMREQLRQINDIKADRIVVNISSLGGDVDHGLAIHDLLASNDAEVETHVIGMTASAATIIAQAGNVRTMSDNALYLVHRAWTIGMGNSNDFEALAKDLNKLDDRISNIYAKRSGFDKDDFMSLMNESNGDGIWISAEEAKEYGLIDEISEPMKAAAFDLSVFDKFGIPKPDSEKYNIVETTDKDSKGISTGIVVPVNIELQMNGKKYDGDFEDLKNEFKKLYSGHDNWKNPIPKQESSDEESVGATSRERTYLQLLKLKQ